MGRGGKRKKERGWGREKGGEGEAGGGGVTAITQPGSLQIQNAS